MDWLNDNVALPDEQYYKKAIDRQKLLTKPLGSLGLLEDIAVRLAAMQKTEQPTIDNIWVAVFAADHGIAEESVSAFPQCVTTEMVKNFINNGAAVNVLCNYVKANFEVIDVGLIKAIDESGIVVARAGNATANFAKLAAMTEDQMQIALAAGKSAVERAIDHQAQLFIGGEMGIANTTSASALAVTLTGINAGQLTGAGTGLANNEIQHKATIIKNAIKLHQKYLTSPLKILQYLGGFEIAALVGAYIFAAQQRLPVLIDGFISSVAALVAVKIAPQANEWFFFAHCSQEKGHKHILKHLKARPLLDLNMRLGEGSGAVTAVPLLQMACKLHSEIATFKQAGISTK